MADNSKTLTTPAPFSGEVIQTSLFSTVSRMFNDTDVRSSAPKFAVIFYDSSFSDLVSRHARMTNSTLTGTLVRAMLARTGVGYNLDTARIRSNPAGALLARSGATTNAFDNAPVETSMYDLVVRQESETVFTSPANYTFATRSASQSPSDVFAPNDWAQTAWWLENFSTVSLTAMREESRTSEVAELIDEEVNSRVNTMFRMADAGLAALVLEYSVLLELGKYVSYPDSFNKHFETKEARAVLDVVEQARVSGAYLRSMAPHYMPYKAIVAGADVTVLPLPACLRYFCSLESYSGPNIFSDDGSLVYTGAEGSKMIQVFFSAIRASYEDWCRDFTRRASSIVSAYSNKWQAYFPSGSTYTAATAAPIPARSAMFDSRKIVMTDGVFTSDPIALVEEPYVDYDDGSLRSLIRLFAFTPFPADDVTPPNALYLTPPETQLYTHRYKNADAPELLSAEMPLNVATPFTAGPEFQMRAFLHETGGVAPDSFPRLIRITTSGPRTIQNGDRTYTSGYFLALENAAPYLPPKFDVSSYILFDESGSLVYPSDDYLRRYFYAGLATDDSGRGLDSDNLLADPQGQRDASLELDSFMSDPNRSFAHPIWRIYRVGRSGGISSSSKVTFTAMRHGV